MNSDNADVNANAVRQPAQEVKAQPAVLRATIQIKRKATGKVETYEIVGTPEPQQEQE
jgi:hypothetical protein